MRTIAAIIATALICSTTSAYAAAKITSKQIKDRTIKQRDVAHHQIGGAIIKPEGVNGSVHISDGSITKSSMGYASVGCDQLAYDVSSQLAGC